MLTCTEVQYGAFGKCVRLTNGTIELLATIDRGPRIIRFGFVGGENEFCELPEMCHPSEEYEKQYGDKGEFHICGGHRLWTAPELMPRTYYPDNAPISYAMQGDTLIVKGNPMRWVQLQAQMEITMDNDRVTVVHRLTNIGAWSVKFAPWSLSVMAPGGLQIIRQNTTDTVFAPNRVLSLWSYTQLSDSRVYFGTRYITLRQDTAATRPFKIGLNSEHPCTVYCNHGNAFVKRYDLVEGAEYPDGGVSFETYTNKDMMEIETLGAYKDTAPGETVTHTEYWQLYKNVSRPDPRDEDAADTLYNSLGLGL